MKRGDIEQSSCQSPNLTSQISRESHITFGRLLDVLGRMIGVRAYAGTFSLTLSSKTSATELGSLAT